MLTFDSRILTLMRELEGRIRRRWDKVSRALSSVTESLELEHSMW
jgi:hypothetical protein